LSLSLDCGLYIYILIRLIISISSENACKDAQRRSTIMPHSDRKLIKQTLNCTFDQVYECLLNSQDKIITNLKTSRGNAFFAIAAESSELGEFIQLLHNNRIYP